MSLTALQQPHADPRHVTSRRQSHDVRRRRERAPQLSISPTADAPDLFKVDSNQPKYHLIIIPVAALGRPTIFELINWPLVADCLTVCYS
jgi:hypothetical protein